MKRSLILSFCAVAVASMAFSPAFAGSGTDIALNLRYTDPADESAGGTFELVAKTDVAGGISGASAYIGNIDLAGVSIDGPNSTIDCNGPCVAINGSVVNIVYGQDLVAPVTGVGTSGGQDDQFGNPAWNGVVVLASGTFGSARPELDPAVNPWGNSTEANVFDGATTPILAVLHDSPLKVRGDGVATDGFRLGDANRDGTVGVGDLGILSAPANWLNTATTWDEGNFNSADGTGVGDLGILSAPANWLSTWSPLPASSGAASAIPEPSTAVLMIGLLSFATAARRRRVGI